MVRSDDRNEVMELAQTHVSMQDHDMTDDDIHNAIEQT